LLSFGALLVVKHSSNQKTSSKRFKTKTAKPMDSSAKKSASSVSRSKKKITGRQDITQEKAQLQGDALEKSIRPENEVVTYAEVDFELKEIIPNDNEVLIGPTRITRFEKARITGARSLQLSLGAPAFIKVPPDVRDSVSLATSELDAKALPISIRRVLPNGVYQDIPIGWLK
jgi:DNA-directed RNA polymerases I, II, and III subunit RPABC2